MRDVSLFIQMFHFFCGWGVVLLLMLIRILLLGWGARRKSPQCWSYTMFFFIYLQIQIWQESFWGYLFIQFQGGIRGYTSTLGDSTSCRNECVDHFWNVTSQKITTGVALAALDRKITSNSRIFTAFHDMEHGFGSQYEFMTIARPVDIACQVLPNFAAAPILPSIDGVALARMPPDPAGTHMRSVALFGVLGLIGQYEADHFAQKVDEHKPIVEEMLTIARSARVVNYLKPQFYKSLKCVWPWHHPSSNRRWSRPTGGDLAEELVGSAVGPLIVHRLVVKFPEFWGQQVHRLGTFITQMINFGSSIGWPGQCSTFGGWHVNRINRG